MPLMGQDARQRSGSDAHRLHARRCGPSLGPHSHRGVSLVVGAYATHPLAHVQARRGPMSNGLFPHSYPVASVPGDVSRRPRRDECLQFPGPIHIIANFRGDTHKIARRHTYAFRITRINPHGVCIGDLIQPLRVPRTGMDQCRQTEGGYKQVLALFGIDVRGMDMAMNIARREDIPASPIL